MSLAHGLFVITFPLLVLLVVFLMSSAMATTTGCPTLSSCQELRNRKQCPYGSSCGNGIYMCHTSATSSCTGVIKSEASFECPPLPSCGDRIPHTGCSSRLCGSSEYTCQRDFSGGPICGGLIGGTTAATTATATSPYTRPHCPDIGSCMELTHRQCPHGFSCAGDTYRCSAGGEQECHGRVVGDVSALPQCPLAQSCDEVNEDYSRGNCFCKSDEGFYRCENWAAECYGVVQKRGQAAAPLQCPDMDSCEQVEDESPAVCPNGYSCGRGHYSCFHSDGSTACIGRIITKEQKHRQSRPFCPEMESCEQLIKVWTTVCPNGYLCGGDGAFWCFRSHHGICGREFMKRPISPTPTPIQEEMESAGQRTVVKQEQNSWTRVNASFGITFAAVAVAISMFVLYRRRQLSNLPASAVQYTEMHTEML